MRYITSDMKPMVLLFLLAAVAGPGVVRAQIGGASPFNPLDPTRSGVRLNGISGYAGDYQGGNGVASSGVGASGGSPFAEGIVYGASASFGWTHFGGRSNLVAGYSASYFGSVRNSDLNSLNHQFSLSWRTQLGSKWGFSISAAGVLSNLQQLLFNPIALSNVASTPSTFEDLAAAMVGGKFTNAQLAAVLTGAPIPASPAQTYFYGQRILSGSLQTGLNWAPTGRTSFQFSASGTRVQNLKAPGETAGSTATSAVAQTTSGSAQLGWSYSLSPRTQISLGASSTRVFAKLEKGYMSSANVSIARTMSRKWFAAVSGGAGFLNYQQQGPATPSGPQYVAGASLGYKTQSHSFVGSYNRTVGDSYGLSAAATSASSASWRWQRPGTGWTVSTSFTYQQLIGSAFGDTTSWQANGVVGRSLNRHMSASLMYGYYQLPSDLLPAGAKPSQSSVVLSMNWSPAAYR